MTRQTDLFIHQKLTGEQLAQYNEQGYLKLGRTLTDEGLERMRNEVMAAWEVEKGPFDPTATWLKNALLADIHHKSDVVRRYYFNGPMVDVAQQIIGPNIKGATSQLTFKMRGNDKPFHWHQDNVYGELDPYNALTVLTALDDSDEENGCLWIVPGSHKEGQADYEHSVEKIETQQPVILDVDESRAVPAPLKAGECLFFHCHMLHKSEGNRSKDRDRRILFLRYADADAVEVYNDNLPRLGRLIRGSTKFAQVEQFEAQLAID